MPSASRTQRRKRLRDKARKEIRQKQEVQQRYAATPGVLSFSNKVPDSPLVEVLPDRHRKNYDAHGNIVFGPRPCALEAQRRALAGQTR